MPCTHFDARCGRHCALVNERSPALTTANLHPKEQQRITKPRTRTNTTTDPSPASYTFPPSDDSSADSTPSKSSGRDRDDSMVHTFGTTSRSRQDARHHLRMHLFGSRDHDLHRDDASPREDDGLGSLASTARDRLSTMSRTGSLYSQMTSARSSTTKVNSTPGSRCSPPADTRIDLEAAIAILQELKKDASPEDLIALHKALLPSKPVDCGHNDATGSPSRSLMRRRSHALPGLATRDTFDILRKPDAVFSSATQQPPPPWKLDDLGASSLTRVSSAESSHDASFTSPQRPQTPRCQTPGDLDYANLGSKLGGLFVTNGPASPAPSSTLSMSRHLTAVRSVADLQQAAGDLYFTANEGRPRDAPADDRAQTHCRPRPAPRLSDDSFAISRCADADSIRRRRPEDEGLDEDQIRQARDARAIFRASFTAEQYLCDLQTNPYDQREADLPARQEPADEGRDDLDDMMNARESARQILESALFTTDKFLAESPRLSLDGHRQRLDGKPQRPLAQLKSDSGYSSRASHAAARPTDTHLLEEDEDEDELAPTPTKEYTLQQMLSEPPPWADEAPAANKAEYTLQQMLSQPPPWADEAPAAKTAERKKSFTRPKSWKRLSRASTNPSERSNSPAVTLSSAKSIPIAIPAAADKTDRQDSVLSEQRPVEANKATAAKPKRLQKRLSQPIVPVVQTSRSIRAGSIPAIPPQLSEHFSERMEASPGVDHLEHTFSSVTRASASPENIPTAVSIRFPSPEPEEAPKKCFQVGKKQKRSRSVQPKGSPGYFDANCPSARGSERAAGEEAPFATAAQVLGSSPYDIATAATFASPSVASIARARSTRPTAAPRLPSHERCASESPYNDAHSPLPSPSVPRAPTPPQKSPLRSSSHPSRNPSRNPSRSPSLRPPITNFSRPHSREDIPRVGPSPSPPVFELPTRSPSAPPMRRQASCPSPFADEKIPVIAEEAGRETAERPKPYVTAKEVWEQASTRWQDRRRSVGEMRRAGQPQPHEGKATTPARPNRASASLLHPHSYSYSHSSALGVKRLPTIRSVASSVAPSSSSKSPEPQQARQAEPQAESQDHPARRARRQTLVPDRYSGGLAYGYEPGVGVGGSTGTRSATTAGLVPVLGDGLVKLEVEGSGDGAKSGKEGRRERKERERREREERGVPHKSRYYASRYGLDLEDVPVSTRGFRAVLPMV